DNQESLWAAFALGFLAQIRSELPLWRRWRSDVHLLRTRFAWTSGATDVIVKVAQVLWYAVAIIILTVLSLNGPKYLRELAARDSAVTQSTRKEPTSRESVAKGP